MPTDLTDRVSGAIGRTAFGRKLSQVTGELRTRAVPGHWTSVFGVVTLACLIVVFATGVFLMFFYTPSGSLVAYAGSYRPLQGIEVSKAFQSTMLISLELNGGLLVRQAHHWAALLLPAALILQLVTTFFTGAFRKPRQWSWVLLFLLFLLALVGGWSGYALPDDALSGTGLRIVEGIVLGVPVVGTWASALLFGGGFPGEIIAHLYPIHTVIVPALLIVVLGLRIGLSYAHKPPQFTGPGRHEDAVVGMPILPNAAARFGGLLVIVMGILLLLAATVTISPIWLYGPASAGDASAGSQPDWYTGFLDGALRLVPSGWEFVLLDRTWTLAVLVPLIVVGVFFAVILSYPFIEGWITGDSRDHHLLDRPRNTPTRTGLGVAGIAFYGALWGAGSADLVSSHFHLSVEGVVALYQALAIFGPILAFELTRRVCVALQKKDRALMSHGYETGRIVRLPGGEYIEVHRPLDPVTRWRMVDRSSPIPVQLRPDDRGHVTIGRRLQASLSRFFFEDWLAPVAFPAETERGNVRELSMQEPKE